MFHLDHRLAADTVELTRWPLCRVLLMNDRAYPWLILVPEREGLCDLHDLAPADHPTVMAEITRAATALQKIYWPDKMNVAALGNAVSQLHIHIIARFKTDAAWPRPVWGVKPTERYDAEALEIAVVRLRQVLA